MEIAVSGVLEDIRCSRLDVALRGDASRTYVKIIITVDRRAPLIGLNRTYIDRIVPDIILHINIAAVCCSFIKIDASLVLVPSHIDDGVVINEVIGAMVIINTCYGTHPNQVCAIVLFPHDVAVDLPVVAVLGRSSVVHHNKTRSLDVDVAIVPNRNITTSSIRNSLAMEVWDAGISCDFRVLDQEIGDLSCQHGGGVRSEVMDIAVIEGNIAESTTLSGVPAHSIKTILIEGLAHSVSIARHIEIFDCYVVNVDSGQPFDPDITQGRSLRNGAHWGQRNSHAVTRFPTGSVRSVDHISTSLEIKYSRGVRASTKHDLAGIGVRPPGAGSVVRWGCRFQRDNCGTRIVEHMTIWNVISRSKVIGIPSDKTGRQIGISVRPVRARAVACRPGANVVVRCHRKARSRQGT